MGRKKKEIIEVKETLEQKLKSLETTFGLKRANKKQDAEYLLTDIYAYDFILDKGIKLVKGGHKIEVYGKESSGKTTLTLKVVKKYQGLGKVCVWIVSESFNKSWATKLGVDMDKLLLFYPKSLEAAGDKLLELIPMVDLIVIDSVASLVPQAEIDRDLDEPTRGLQAKLYSTLCRKIYNVIPDYKTTLIFINQIRINMNKTWGNPEDTPCGMGLRFMYDSRIQVSSGAFIEEGTKEKKLRIGKEIHLYGKKNKLGEPQRKISMDFYFKGGRIDNKKSLFFAAIKYGIIEMSGKTYTFKDTKIVGKLNFVNQLQEEKWKEIEKEIWKITE